jgi:phosphoribosylglycinamide formyltransferase-1
MKRLAVIISGRGSNLGAILEAIARHDWPIQIASVISNRPAAAGLEIARCHGVPTAVVDHGSFIDREAYDRRLAEELDRAAPDLVVLAGFMRILSGEFCRHFQGRLMNIHPSLLPAFKGMHTHQQAIDAGVRIHGCTVHLVTPDLDHGPILAQGIVPVLDSDDASVLGDRVLEMEHQIYPHAIAAYVSGRLVLSEGRILDRGAGAFPCEYRPWQLHHDL